MFFALVQTRGAITHPLGFHGAKSFSPPTTNSTNELRTHAVPCGPSWIARRLCPGARPVVSASCAYFDPEYITPSSKEETFGRKGMMDFCRPRAAWVGCVLAGLLVADASGAKLKRNANNTLRFPARPAAYAYQLVNAFGDLSFTIPVGVASPPGENRVFIVEQTGKIIVVPDPGNPSRAEFLDLSGKVADANPSEEGGLLALAFHPNYAANGHFFVYYVCNTVTADGSGRHDRLSRFTRSRNDPNKADPGSEVVLFSQYDEKFNHNGGALAFGPDGYLYVALGDEGHPDDMFNNAQRIDKDFFSAVLRIDVDEKAGNLTPNPHPALGGRVNYRVPNDNPYVRATSFNGLPVDRDRVRTEFYAVGVRSPWRLHWDLPGNTLYLTDVGENSGEEVNVIVSGGNYGWPYRLANEPGPKADQAPPGFSSIGPAHTYPRGDSGPDVGRSVIGGVVYRGQNLPELNGGFIFGDYYSGNLWMLRGGAQFLMAMPQFRLVAFGTDPRNGDVLVCDIGDGQIKRLVRTSGDDVLPLTLADAGAFSDLATLTPHEGIVPYDINVPFWSDGATKTRWFSVPDPNAKIRASPHGPWDFPEGSIFIKHFDLEMVKGDPNTRRRVETRFIVRNPDGVYGVTYRWNDAQNNATLVNPAGDYATYTVNDGGVTRHQVWRFPSHNECITCHNPVGGPILGLKTSQMNRVHGDGSSRENQLRALARAGYFSRSPGGAKALAPASNTRASLEWRVRSYLDANCAFCHQPGGSGRALWDGRSTTPTARAGIVNGGLTETFGDPAQRVIAPQSTAHSMVLARVASPSAARMPPLGSTVVDDEAIALLTQWINSLPRRKQPLKVRLTAPRQAVTGEQVVTLRGTAQGDNLSRVVVSLNGGSEFEVGGVANWFAEVPLQPGVNRAVITAISSTGERSRSVNKLIKRR